MTASESPSSLDLWGFVRRQWWLIAGTAIVAALVAAALSAGASTSYEAKTLVTIDPVTLSSNGRLPRPDALIAIAESDEFRAELADATGESEDAIGSGLNVYTVGTPQTELWVAYSGSSAQVARDVSREATEMLLERQRELTEPVLELQRTYIEDAERLIDELQGSDNPDAPYQVWSVERNLVADRNTLEYLETVYSPPGVPVESASTQRTALLRGALGGLAVGLLVGTVLAVIREMRFRRAAEASAG